MAQPTYNNETLDYFINGSNDPTPYNQTADASGGSDVSNAPSGQTGIRYQGTGNVRNDWNTFVNAGGYTGAYGRNNLGSMSSQFNQQYGYNTRAGNNNAAGTNDTVDFGDGNGWIDLIHGGDNAWQWLQENQNTGGGGGAAPASAAPYTPVAPFQAQSRAAMAGPMFDSGAINGQVNDLLKYFLDSAQGKITDANNPNLKIDPNNPIIKGQVDAANAQGQNTNRNYLSGLAERGANQNLSAETRAANESLAQNTAGLQANLMGNELTAQRQKIQQMLAGAAGILTNQQQAALQEQLYRLNLTEQQHQFDVNTGERAWEFGVNDQFRNSPLGS